MTTALRIRGGDTYTGRTIQTIIRREFGRTAMFRPNHDRTSPEAGTVIAPSVAGGFNVLAEVIDITHE